MCEAGTATSVEGLRRQLNRLVRLLDPADVPLPEAPGLLASYATIERLASIAVTLLAARVAESAVAEREGRRPDEWLAERTGTSPGAAKRRTETSRRLEKLPAMAEAARSGSLSAEQAEAIADAASVAGPEAGQKLVDLAGTASLSELKDECRRVRAAADPDPDATEARIHARRSLRRWRDPEGAWHAEAVGPLTHGAELDRALEPLIDEQFHSARADGRKEGREAYAFDALIELARRGAGTTTADDKPRAMPYRSLIRVDASALERGAVEGDERCEIAGLGPISVERARALLGESVLHLVLTKGTDVVNLTYLGQGPSAVQKLALAWSMPTCTRQGCGRLRVQYDHRVDWRLTHHTRLDELDPLCPTCHRLKTRKGWALVEGTGARPMVPPEDPSHPACRAPPLFGEAG